MMLDNDEIPGGERHAGLTTAIRQTCSREIVAVHTEGAVAREPRNSAATTGFAPESVQVRFIAILPFCHPTARRPT
jgi:hypothetical protein